MGEGTAGLLVDVRLGVGERRRAPLVCSWRASVKAAIIRYGRMCLEAANACIQGERQWRHTCYGCMAALTDARQGCMVTLTDARKEQIDGQAAHEKLHYLRPLGPRRGWTAHRQHRRMIHIWRCSLRAELAVCCIWASFDNPTIVSVAIPIVCSLDVLK